MESGLFTPDQIYKFGNEATEKQLDAIINKMEEKELNLYNSLITLGDSKGVAVFTAISEKYKSDSSKEYNNAYNN